MKNLTDKSLRFMYNIGQTIPYIVSQDWGIHLVNFTTKFIAGQYIQGLSNEERYIPSKSGGPDIRIRIYKPLHVKGKLPLLLYIHGGGYVVGNPEYNPAPIQQYIKKRPCIVIAPAYRKAFEAPYPAAFNDCYETILWAKENAQNLGILEDNFIIAGHSAGGGLTAAVTLKARDTQDFKIAFQMPFYPMIDDRQNTESAKTMKSVPIWNAKSSKKGWEAYLKDIHDKNEEVPAYAAAARNKDYSNFPPTITYVGELEPFKDETIAYVEALQKEGIETKFQLYKGAFHAFETFAPFAEVSKDAVRFVDDAFAEFYDKYVK